MKQQFIQQLHSSFHSRAFLLRRSPLIVPIFSSLALFYRPCNVYWVCVRGCEHSRWLGRNIVYRGFFDNGKKRKNSPGKTLAMSNSANTKDANRPRARPHHVAVSRFRIEHGPPLAAGDKEQKKTTNSLPVTEALSRVKFCLRWAENCIKDKCILPSTFPLTSAIKQRNSFSFSFYFFLAS